MIPPPAPIRKARMVSTNVIQRCPQISPLAKRVQHRFRTSSGVEKKNWTCLAVPEIG
jgi:hypothetical protein